MPESVLKCPNCGAPLDWKAPDAPFLTCPYCHTAVPAPAELRQTAPQPAAQGGGRLAGILGGGVLLLAVFVVGVVMATNRPPAAPASPTRAVLAAPTQVSTLTSAPSPTPGFANPGITFGGPGTGEGLFSDGRYVAVDGSGYIYVADYQGGRIQRFDSQGRYRSQWQVGNDPKLVIAGLAANHAGVVFASAGGSIYRYTGQTGKLLGVWASHAGGSYGDLAATSLGGVAAMWYQSRWGVITSLEGHRENLVVFDADGNVTLTVASLISGQTNELALDVSLAVDGTGKIYALSDGLVFSFSPQGQFLDRTGSPGEGTGQFRNPVGVAVDGQGRLYVVDSGAVHVFDADGRYLADFAAPRADMLAIDSQGAIWAIARDHVTQYLLRGS